MVDDNSTKKHYDPNKYKKMREDEHESFFDEEIADGELYVPISKTRKTSSVRVLDLKKPISNNQDQDTAESNKDNEETQQQQSLVDEFFILKKELHENTSSNNEIILGKNSFATHTIRDKQENLTSISSSWTIPRSFRNIKSSQIVNFLKKNKMYIDGVDIPPPVKHFRQLKIPSFLLKILCKHSINQPIPIQSQCFPIIFSGRDLIARSFTGTGKSLLFELSFICFAIQQEIRQPLRHSEGPWFLYVSPSRELASQTFKVISEMAKEIFATKMIKLKLCLAIGGIPIREQLEKIDDGIHILIATTGRLSHLLSKSLRLNMCQIICIDEANVMADGFYGEEIVQLIPKLPKNHQTIILSTVEINTMPHALLKSLTNTPIVVQSLLNTLHTITQKFYLIDQENKLPIILEILQQTPPPVLIFAFLKDDVDLITEYLLLKGLEAVALHSDKSQIERDEALEKFTNSADILVATDIASKGLDFKNVRHVINYEVPEEIDLYIHRIGRTGRHGKEGLSTTIVEKGSNIRTLVEIKKHLIECGQDIPSFFNTISVENNSI
ncbi:MAG: DEAD (Asp-Glu-Ala-Asp) box polypeptide 41 [Marteilia pararefringens]